MMKKTIMIWMFAILLIIPLSFADPINNTLAYWTLDDSDLSLGNFSNSVNESHALEINGSLITGATGKINEGATDFTTGRFLRTSPMEITDNLTVSVWVDTVSNINGNLIGKMPLNAAWNLFITADTGITLRGGGATQVTAGFDDFNNNTFNCISAVINGTTGYILINGTIVAEGTVDAILNPMTEGINDVYVGVGQLSSGSFLDPLIGTLDEIYVSDDAKTTSDLKEICDNGDNGLQFPFDTVLPTFGVQSINNSNPIINEVIRLSQIVNDETQLNSYNIAHNQTGTFVNQTPVDISGTTFNASVDLTITLPKNNVIGFQWTVNDSTGNSAISGISTFTTGNNPPETPTIIFPTPALFTNIVPVDINVTFPADLDGDVITITYYLNGQFNQTSSGNISISPNDATIILNVSIDDGTATSSNATVTFTVDTSAAILTIISPIDTTAFDLDIPVDILCTDMNLVSLEYILVNSSGIQDFVINSTPEGNELTIRTSITIATLGLGTYDFNSTCATATSENATSSVTISIIAFEEKTSQLLNQLLTIALTIGFTIFALVIAKREIFTRRSKK